MALFSESVIKYILKSVFWADRMVRSDLVLGLISSENDYTSNLTCTIRRQINCQINLRTLRATSLVLKPTVERKVGCDACILLSNTDTQEFKVCLFEAKWPRLKTQKNYWDKVHKERKVSHFSEQLDKQASLPSSFAVWEIFYCEYPFGEQPSWMVNKTSSCVWHRDAYQQNQARNRSARWTDQELETLLSGQAMQLDHVVEQVCRCREGTKFSGSDYRTILAEYDLPAECLLIEYSAEGFLDD